MDEEKRALAAMEVPELELPPSGPRRPTSGASARPVVAPSSLDDDGLGMELERDVTGSPGTAPPSGARAARPRGLADAPPTRPSSGLEVAYRRLEPVRRAEDDGPSKLARALGPIGAALLGGGALWVMLRFVHQPSGVAVTSMAPRAFDGTSASTSGAVAVAGLVAAVAIGYVGVRARTRSWWLVACAAATMLLALAMATVTLGSMGESAVPPDGALLVPWLAPLAMMLGGVDVLRRSAHRLTHARGAAKLGGVALALGSAALLFAALETSRAAALLPAW